MRKESAAIARAFAERRSARGARTKTDGRTVWLHDNAIAWWDDDTLCLTLAGWPTTTTRDRLNAICEVVIGRRLFRRKDYVTHYKDQPIQHSQVVRIDIVPILAYTD